jgi:hypothetical protein
MSQHNTTCSSSGLTRGANVEKLSPAKPPHFIHSVSIYQTPLARGGWGCIQCSAVRIAKNESIKHALARTHDAANKRGRGCIAIPLTGASCVHTVCVIFVFFSAFSHLHSSTIDPVSHLGRLPDKACGKMAKAKLMAL